MNTTETKDGTIIEIFVKPNSQNFEINIEGEEIVIRCTEEPTKSKVNKELTKEFTKLFHTKVELVSGATSKQKRFLITNLKKTETDQLLLKENALYL
jgi:uncharacterized protein (TIGR00251 family)